jgi:UDP-N-acetylmuramyl pentapeptide phosphotransferase/UDP-N-acetylglucosamine-1-phosphate transferase
MSNAAGSGSWLGLAGSAGLAAVAAWLLTAALIPVLRRHMLDQPNARSSHANPTPRGGGGAFVLVVGLAWLWQGSWWLLWCLPLALVGLIDDRRGLPVAWRYGVQVLTAGALLLHPVLPGVSASWWVVPVVLIAATALINFTNFMDGLDGLVAGCMTLVFAVAALRGLPQLWPLVGALLGFLPWNWSPARVFMGDGGSTFLGVVLVAALLHCGSWGDAFGLSLVALPLLADALSCVVRRALAGQPVLQAHRLHLYQRLHQAGWSHRRVSGTYLAATAALALLLLTGGWPVVLVGAIVLLGIGFSLDRSVAVPFAKAAALAQAAQLVQSD